MTSSNPDRSCGPPRQYIRSRHSAPAMQSRGPSGAAFLNAVPASSGDLWPSTARRTSATMADELFDMRLRAMRRDRAFRSGPELFLYERAFDDILDRLSLIRREFKSALLIGCPDPGWKHRLQSIAGSVDVVDPGPCFAEAAGGACIIEDQTVLPGAAYDLCIAVGTLDSVNDLPAALCAIRAALLEGALLLGAIPGGETLPELRAAMRAADQQAGVASPHAHPRIQPSSLAGLLTACGFSMPVIDVDQVRVSYGSLRHLVRDLRAMGVTNVLKGRSPAPLRRPAAGAAAERFGKAGKDGKTTELFEILHFAAWTS